MACAVHTHEARRRRRPGFGAGGAQFAGCFCAVAVLSGHHRGPEMAKHAKAPSSGRISLCPPPRPAKQASRQKSNGDVRRIPRVRVTMGRAISQTKNYALSGGGDPAEKLELVDKEEPVPGSTPPGYVLVRLKLRAINPTDLTTVRIDRFSRLSGSSEIIVGSEGTGVVKEVGEGVTQFSVGQRVTPIIFLRYLKDAQGSWQEYICVKAAHVFPIPDSVTDEVAAQLVVNSCIALGLLKEVQVPKGEFLLQTGAASVIGRQIIQLAKHFGIKTINIVRRDAAKAELEALGGNVVINSTKEDVLQIVKEVTNGKLAYAAFDAVVDENTKILASSVRNEGRLVIWGALASWDVRLGLLDLMRKVRVGCWILYDEVPTEEELKKLGDEVLELLEQKVVQPLVGETFDLADYKKALKATERPARGGKVYLKG